MSMSVSFIKSSNKTNVKHNNREFTEKQKQKNPHIDYLKSGENKFLVHKDLKELYEQEFSEVLQKYNDKQKRNDRKIENYYEHIKDSKKTALQQEMIIQVGDKDDFNSPENFEIANEVLEEWFFDFEKRNPNLKVYNAIIHNDEASPHLHLNFVPVAGDYKRGLEKQVSFDRAIIQQDKTLNKQRPFNDWREKEVDLVADLLQKRGIERKLVGTNEYKDVNEYKKMQDLEKELSKKIAIKQDQLTYLKAEADIDENKFEDLKGYWKTEKVEVPSGEKTILGKDKMKTITKKTDKVEMGIEAYKELRKIAKESNKNKNQVELYQNFDFENDWAELTLEVKELKSELDEEKQDNYKLINDFGELLEEKGEVVKENNLLKREIADLRTEIKSIYKSTKNILKERTTDFKAFMKKIADDVVSDLKDNKISSSFKKEFDKENKHERTKSRGIKR